jgi:hypothetical protein
VDISPYARHQAYKEKYFLRYNFLTLPVTKEGVTHHSQLISEVNKLVFSQTLYENVFYLLLCGYVLKLNYSSLNIFSDEMVFDLNVF